ncbi:MAG: response regulator [Planctomycetes bacterium]|nr:response regulator [Planctomycetota bacterium]
MDERVKILVAEDEPSILSLFETILEERNDCEYQLAADGLEALERLLECPPDLLITDLRMPRLSGEELAARALKSCPDVTILVATGNGTLESAIQMFRGGVHDFITKPFVMSELLMTLDRAISESRQRKRRRSADDIVQCLMKVLEAKDPYLQGHSRRVSLLARAMGTDLGMNPAEIESLEWAALVHDLGKIGVPDILLNKKGELTEEEYDAVKLHSVYSADIIRPLACVKGGECAVDAVCHHHERVDGRGYPSGLDGRRIPFFSRIISVCDAYDAMTSCRSYRQAMSDEEAREQLRRGAGKQFDADLVDTFLKNLDRYKSDVIAEEYVC